MRIAVKSIEFYTLSCEIYYKFGDNKKCAQLKVNIGEKFYVFEEDKSRAIKYLEEALSIYEDLHYIKEKADVHKMLGDIYMINEIPDLALENYKSAQNSYMELQDEDNLKLLEEKIRSLRNL